MSKISGSILPVGSVPLSTTEEVFANLRSPHLRSLVSAYPDGEVGDRKYWNVLSPDTHLLGTPRP